MWWCSVDVENGIYPLLGATTSVATEWGHSLSPSLFEVDEEDDQEDYTETSCIRIRKECLQEPRCHGILKDFWTYCRESKRKGICMTTQQWVKSGNSSVSCRALYHTPVYRWTGIFIRFWNRYSTRYVTVSLNKNYFFFDNNVNFIIWVLSSLFCILSQIRVCHWILHIRKLTKAHFIHVSTLLSKKKNIY